MYCVTGLRRVPSTAEAFRYASTSGSGWMPPLASRSRSCLRKPARPSLVVLTVCGLQLGCYAMTISLHLSDQASTYQNVAVTAGST